MMRFLNLYQFQFHKGAIRTLATSISFRVSIIYFNSIKVRLEQARIFEACGVLLFQFHKGAIRTLMKLSVKERLSDFNSIKVRLELSRLTNPATLKRYFNSIKVRLELPACRKVARTQQFQFHKGAIRTNASAMISSGIPNFNSIKVRLELYVGAYVCALSAISIP